MVILLNSVQNLKKLRSAIIGRIIFWLDYDGKMDIIAHSQRDYGQIPNLIFVVGMINKPRRMANQIEDVRMSKLSRTANPQKKVHCCCGRIHVYTLNTVLQNNSRVQ